MARAIGLVLAALLVVPTPMAAQDFKQFRDWYVACDNLRNCSAFGFDAELSWFSYLRLERGGAADAQPRITITVQVPKGATFTLSFDDPKLPGLPAAPQTGEQTNVSDELRRISIAATDALIESVRRAQTIVITREGPALKDDEKRSSLSLTGAVAAMLWIDEQQKRLDTTTALIRRGSKPASAVPPQPKAPVIAAIKGQPKIAVPKPPASLLAQARNACDGDARTRGESADSLAAGLSLYAFSCPEMSGAYNMHSVWFIVPDGQPQAARPVSFRWPIQVGDIEQDPDAGVTAVNSSFDPKTATLDIFNKGRGLGDCGTQERWVFDGKAFRLAELKLMSECRGVLSDDWPVVYRAQVKR